MPTLLSNYHHIRKNQIEYKWLREEISSNIMASSPPEQWISPHQMYYVTASSVQKTSNLWESTLQTLSGNSHGSVWVYGNTLESFPTAHHRPVWSTIKSKKWPYLSWNQTLHLWITTRWISCKCTAPKIPCSIRTLRTWPHTRTLVVRHKTYSVHIGCGKFWGQICRKRICQAPHQHHQ